LKAMGERVAQLINELGSETFPTYSQIKIMLKAEGYPPGEVDKWFAGEPGHDFTRYFNQQARSPRAFRTEGQTSNLPLDAPDCQS